MLAPSNGEHLGVPLTHRSASRPSTFLGSEQVDGATLANHQAQELDAQKVEED